MKRLPSNESGFTLVLGLVFILVASMSAVTLMRGSVMQEQMTSNMNNKAISFMAAEAGANALRAKLVGKWPKTADELNVFLNISEKFGSDGSYRVTSISGGGANPIVAEITGYATQDSHLLGTATIQVAFGMASLNLPAAITLAGNVRSFDGGNSNNFSVGGGGVPAIATQSAASNKVVVDGIPKNRVENYSSDSCSLPPCVGVKDLGSPWGDANQLMTFVDAIKNDPSVAYFDGDWVNKSFDNTKPITVVSGDMEIKGNQIDYQGVIIVLGGDFTIKGGGNTEIVGAIFVANLRLDSDGSWVFGESAADISGGGKVDISYDASMGSSVLQPTVLSWRETI